MRHCFTSYIFFASYLLLPPFPMKSGRQTSKERQLSFNSKKPPTLIATVSHAPVLGHKTGDSPPGAHAHTTDICITSHNVGARRWPRGRMSLIYTHIQPTRLFPAALKGPGRTRGPAEQPGTQRQMCTTHPFSPLVLLIKLNLEPLISTCIQHCLLFLFQTSTAHPRVHLPFFPHDINLIKVIIFLCQLCLTRTLRSSMLLIQTLLLSTPHALTFLALPSFSISFLDLIQHSLSCQWIRLILYQGTARHVLILAKRQAIYVLAQCQLHAVM